MMVESFGHYELRTEVGRGGQGTVYRAFDTTLRREVAIKVPLPANQGNPAYTKAFIREAQAAARISSANIVTIHSIGTIGDTPYIDMEFIPNSLASLIKDGSLTIPDIVDIAIQTCTGLGDAHNEGVVHQDIKPQNILITTDGTVKIADFGLATIADESQTASVHGGGTPAYMPPEQWQQSAPSEITPQTDVYALGVVLYQLVAGKLPFEGNTFELMWAHNNSPVPPFPQGTPITDELRDLIFKCLEKQPTARFVSTQAMSEALKGTNPGKPQPPQKGSDVPPSADIPESDSPPRKSPRPRRQKPDPPSKVTAKGTGNSGAIKVTWNAPAGSPTATKNQSIRQYIVRRSPSTVCPLCDSGMNPKFQICSRCGTPRSAVSDFPKQVLEAPAFVPEQQLELLIENLQNRHNYEFSVTSLSDIESNPSPPSTPTKPHATAGYQIHLMLFAVVLMILALADNFTGPGDWPRTFNFTGEVAFLWAMLLGIHMLVIQRRDWHLRLNQKRGRPWLNLSLLFIGILVIGGLCSAAPESPQINTPDLPVAAAPVIATTALPSPTPRQTATPVINAVPVTSISPTVIAAQKTATPTATSTPTPIMIATEIPVTSIKTPTPIQITIIAPPAATATSTPVITATPIPVKTTVPLLRTTPTPTEIPIVPQIPNQADYQSNLISTNKRYISVGSGLADLEITVADATIDKPIAIRYEDTGWDGNKYIFPFSPGNDSGLLQSYKLQFSPIIDINGDGLINNADLALSITDLAVYSIDNVNGIVTIQARNGESSSGPRDFTVSYNSVQVDLTNAEWRPGAVKITSSSDPTGFVLVLKETANDSSIFKGTIGVAQATNTKGALNPVSSQRPTISGAAGDTVTISYWTPASPVIESIDVTIIQNVGSGTDTTEKASGAPPQLISLNNPESVAVDSSGNIYIADSGNHVIRKVHHTTGAISSIAGSAEISGFKSDNLAAVNSLLNYPQGITFGPTGSLYIADSRNHIIRRLDMITGMMSVVAGVPQDRFPIVESNRKPIGDGGPSVEAKLYQPNDVAVDGSSNIFISDLGHSQVRWVDFRDSHIYSVAFFSYPRGIAAKDNNYVYVTDAADNQVLELYTPTWVTSRAAGSFGEPQPGWSGDGARAQLAHLNHPAGIAVDFAGNIYIADSDNHCIRRIDAGTKIISTVAGTFGQPGSSDTSVTAVEGFLDSPKDIALDSVGNLYIADTGNDLVRAVNMTTGIMSIIAGTNNTDQASQ